MFAMKLRSDHGAGVGLGVVEGGTLRGWSGPDRCQTIGGVINREDKCRKCQKCPGVIGNESTTGSAASVGPDGQEEHGEIRNIEDVGKTNHLARSYGEPDSTNTWRQTRGSIAELDMRIRQRKERLETIAPRTHVGGSAGVGTQRTHSVAVEGGRVTSYTYETTGIREDRSRVRVRGVTKGIKS